jgi:hypothetical protein
MGKVRLRKLVVDDTMWLWSVQHQHQHGQCREVVSLYHQQTKATLKILFYAAPGRFVADGCRHIGLLGNSNGNLLNLHTPGTIRSLLQQAIAHHMVPTKRGEKEINGWPLFDAIISHKDTPATGDI